jgi:hypothetical protein
MIINPQYFTFPAKLYYADGKEKDSFYAYVEKGIITIPKFNETFKHDLESGNTEYFDDQYQKVSLNIYELIPHRDYMLVGVFTSGTSAEVLMGRFPDRMNLRGKIKIKALGDFSISTKKE